MTLFSNQPGDEGLPGHERARVMAAVMTTTLMGVFDGTMINIALPSMASAMQVPANVAVWFANGYLLSAAMTLAIFAALAARVGYRPVFLTGLAVFTLTSLGCALARTPDMLIGMRILQGIGGAATLSIAPAILRAVFPVDCLAAFWDCTPCLSPPARPLHPYWAGRSWTYCAGSGYSPLTLFPERLPCCWPGRHYHDNRLQIPLRSIPRGHCSPRSCWGR